MKFFDCVYNIQWVNYIKWAYQLFLLNDQTKEIISRHLV